MAESTKATEQDQQEPQRRPRRGRPPGEAAASHDAILGAVHDLLQETSVRDLTIEQVAKRAGVGKPTIYKWWPSKAALVLDMFEERIVPKLAVPPDATTAEQAIRSQAMQLIRLLNGFFGKVAAEIIAEGQSEPDVLRAYRERYLLRRRAYTADLIARGKATAEFKPDTDPELVTDLIYGTIYYRLLIGHQTLDKRFGEHLLDTVMTCIRL